MSMIECATNFVCVRPEGEPGRTRSGIATTDAAEAHLLMSCVGIVESVCQGVYYGGYEVLEARGKYGHATRRALQYSVQYDVPIEIKVGDRVIFENTVNVSESTVWFDGAAIFRYDFLLGRIEQDTVYPLNGGVFVERFDSRYDAGGLYSHESMMPGYGKVVAAGCRIKSYLLWPERGADFDIPLVGEVVMFQAKHAVRIEHDAYRLLQGESQYPLYHLHRYSIFSIMKDG